MTQSLNCNAQSKYMLHRQTARSGAGYTTERSPDSINFFGLKVYFPPNPHI